MRTVQGVLSLLLLGACCPSALASEDDEHDHGHGAHDWEWAGVFELEAGETYTWTAARNAEGEYENGDTDMKLVIVPASAATQAGLEGAEEDAETLWDADSWTDVTSGDLLQVGTGKAYKLIFDQTSWVSSYRIQVPSTGAYATMVQHFPVEFENEFHYLRDEHGTDIEPGATEPEAAEESEAEPENSLGLVVGIAILSALPGLLMILVAGPMVKKLSAHFFPFMHAFASGAIFACAVFLLLPEGLHMAGSGVSEVTAAWSWGTAILSGWILCVIIHHAGEIVAARLKAPGTPVTPKNGDEGEESAAQNPEAPPSPPVTSTAPMIADWSVAGPVLIGDFWHNLVDGMVIGFAGKACGSTMLWTLGASTIAHEVPQEVADFLILITSGKMSIPVATASNFFAAFSAVVIGALIAYEVDVSQTVQGVSLAFGAGVYIYVATTELGQAIMSLNETLAGPGWTDARDLPDMKTALLRSFGRLSMFAVGAICIGLVLINHEHCSAGGGEEGADPHAGHHH